jgi:hypothetical protein
MGLDGKLPFVPIQISLHGFELAKQVSLSLRKNRVHMDLDALKLSERLLIFRTDFWIERSVWLSQEKFSTLRDLSVRSLSELPQIFPQSF